MSKEVVQPGNGSALLRVMSLLFDQVKLAISLGIFLSIASGAKASCWVAPAGPGAPVCTRTPVHQFLCMVRPIFQAGLGCNDDS